MLEQNYSHDSISVWKRIGIFVLDTAICFIFYLLVFFLVGNPIIKSISSSSIEIVNQHYSNVCESNNVDYKIEDQYGLYVLDFDAYMDKKVNEGLTNTEAFEKYNELESSINKTLSEIPEYVSSYNKFYLNYSLVVVISMFVSLFIFQLVMPLLTKKHQTPAMKIFKSALRNKKDGETISKSSVLLRFFLIFTTEFICVYIILDWFGLIFLLLITFFSISFTKSKATIHDLIMKTEVKKEEYVYTK